MRSFAFTYLATAALLLMTGAASAAPRSGSGYRTACCGVVWAPVDRRGPTFPANDFLLPDSAWNDHSPSTAGTSGPSWTLRQPVFGPPLPTLTTPRHKPYIILNGNE